MPEKIIHCPKCFKPVLKDAVFNSAVSFSLRCPWCQVTLKVKVELTIMIQEAIPTRIPDLEKIEVIELH